MKEILGAPLTRLGLSEADATKISEALSVDTVRGLATNQHFLLAQNCYLLAEANATGEEAFAEKKHPFLELVSSITGATVLLAALLYAAGWSYLYQYYKAFGIRVTELNLPLYDALIYALTVIFHDGWSVFWLVLLIVIGSAILNIKFINKNLLTPLGIGLFLVAILSLGFWLSYKGAKLGVEQAQQDRLHTGTNLPNIRLKLLPEAQSTDAKSEQPVPGLKKNAGTGNNLILNAGSTEQEFDQAGYKLLIHANQQYYFFRPIKDEPAGDPAKGPALPASNLDLFIIPDSRVRAVYIQRGI